MKHSHVFTVPTILLLFAKFFCSLFFTSVWRWIALQHSYLSLFLIISSTTICTQMPRKFVFIFYEIVGLIINHQKKLNPGHVHSYFLFTFSESIDNSIILKIEVIEDIYISCSSLRLWMNSMEISFKTYLQFNPLSRVCFYHDTVSLYAFW